MAKKTLISRKFKKGEYAGQTVIMPYVGEVTFEKDGTLVLEDTTKGLASLLKDTIESFNFYVKEDEAKKEVAVKGKKGAKAKVNISPEEEEAQEEEQDDTERLRAEQELKEKLEGLAGKELLELAKDAGFGIEAAGYTDKRLRKELLKKLLE